MLLGVLADVGGESTAERQAVSLQIGRADEIEILVRHASGARLDLSGGRVLLAFADAHGEVVATLQAQTVTAQGLASISVSAGAFVSTASGPYEYDVVFIDDAGAYGDVGAYHQIVPPSPLLLGT